MLINVMFDNNVSLYQLQKKTNIAYTTLHDLYSMKTTPDKINVKTLKHLADIFNITLDDMYNKLQTYSTDLHSPKYNIVGKLVMNHNNQMLISFVYENVPYCIEYDYPSYQYLQQIFSSQFSLDMHLDACSLAITVKINEIIEQEAFDKLKKECGFYEI